MSTITAAYVNGEYSEQRTAPERPRPARSECPPERLERLANRCSAFEPDGTQCRVFTLHRECCKHRRQQRHRGDE